MSSFRLLLIDDDQDLAAMLVEYLSDYDVGPALVRRIAELHGRDAHCLPRPGGGSVFEVNLLDSVS